MSYFNTHNFVLLYSVQPTLISRATVIIVSPPILLPGQELNKFAKLVVNSQQINIMAMCFNFLRMLVVRMQNIFH